MTPSETLLRHQHLCDELHQLALEENRFLKQHQRAPEAALLERKKLLLARLDESLSALKALNISLQEAASQKDEPTPSGLKKADLEKVRSRVMQILHLDRENEQLLFRYSLSSPRPQATQPPPSQLQRMYQSVQQPPAPGAANKDSAGRP